MTCACSPCATSSSAATSASRGCWSARTSRGFWQISLRATGTCCPTSASPRARSSMAQRPPIFPGQLKSSKPTVSRFEPHSSSDMSLPLVAVVGRPNVGKSTLVNRIVGRREAIVEEEPGVTRDRKILEADWNGRDFLVVDTGGWIATQDGIDAQVSRQAERAIAEADVVLLVVDATVGVTEEDDRVGGLLRRSNKPVVVVANKVDES